MAKSWWGRDNLAVKLRLVHIRVMAQKFREVTVGIDLAPASSGAPGTARHVAEQARALFALDLDWQWKPLIESQNNPLTTEAAGRHPLVVSGKSVWRRATFAVGRGWQKAGCAIGFSTAYFVPWKGQPVVANFFDSNIYEHFDTWVKSGRLLNAMLIRVLSDYAVRRSRRLFVNSHYCADYLRKRFPGQAGKFVVAPPGILAPITKKVEQVPRWATGLRKPFLLYVGVFSENKNQRRLIEAHALLGEGAPALVLLGPCDGDFKRRFIEGTISHSKNGGDVILPGKVSEEELNWAYQNALAYVQPSIAEGFGLPVVEAMSHGLPVACSNTTSLPETAGPAALFFDPLDPVSISAALQTLAFDVPERERLKVLGSTRWQEFTWQRNASIVATEIEGVLKEIKILS